MKVPGSPWATTGLPIRCCGAGGQPVASLQQRILTTIAGILLVGVLAALLVV